MPISIEDIRAARESIRSHIHRTPLFGSRYLSGLTATDLFLKAENLQKTGSFKPRGVVNAVLALSRQEQARGVLTFSAGNTASALAYAAASAGVPAVVLMPETAPRGKIEAVRGYGAELILEPMERLLTAVEEVRDERDLSLLHPWENRHLIAGHGTIGLEILEDVPDVELVVVPVGGGGLIAGIASAVKALRPEVRVIGVEPEGSTSVAQSLAAGTPVTVTPCSIADGLNAPSTAPTPLGIIRDLVDALVTVPDVEIARAMRTIIERTKLVVEPSGAVAVAALASGAIPDAEGKRTVAILSGGNVDLARLAELVG
jgi:threonine dehydratase